MLWVAWRNFVGIGIGNLLPGMATVVGMMFGSMQSGSNDLLRTQEVYLRIMIIEAELIRE